MHYYFRGNAIPKWEMLAAGCELQGVTLSFLGLEIKKYLSDKVFHKPTYGEIKGVCARGGGLWGPICRSTIAARRTVDQNGASDVVAYYLAGG